MNEKLNRTIEQARRLTGQPVCVVLNDGSYYIGQLQGTKNGQLQLAGKKMHGRMRTSPPSKRKAKVSGFFPGFGTGFGGAGPGAAGAAAGSAAGSAAGGGLFGGLGGLAGIMGFMKTAMPMIQMGMGLIRQIMPLMSLFKK
jgi:hypothetical protein